jgi:hypothetical protein
MLTVGDVVEWVAGGLLVSAAWVAGGEAAGLASAGVFAFYEAQVLAGSTITIRKRTKKERDS